MAQFYFTGEHLGFLEGRDLIFKIGRKDKNTNIAKHHKTQMYPIYFLTLFLAQK